MNILLAPNRELVERTQFWPLDISFIVFQTKRSLRFMLESF